MSLPFDLKLPHPPYGSKASVARVLSHRLGSALSSWTGLPPLGLFQKPHAARGTRRGAGAHSLRRMGRCLWGVPATKTPPAAAGQRSASTL